MFESDRCQQILINEENNTFPGKVHCHDTFYKIYNEYYAVDGTKLLSHEQFFQTMIECGLIMSIVQDLLCFIIVC